MRSPLNPSGLCLCGCGEVTGIITETNTRLNMHKGDHYRYIFGHARRNKTTIKTKVDPRSGCAVWIGSLHKGRPQIAIGGKAKIAARVYYEDAKGTIPDGYEIHHLCWNRLCVNPEHLLAISKLEHRRCHQQAFLDCADILHQRFCENRKI